MGATSKIASETKFLIRGGSMRVDNFFGLRRVRCYLVGALAVCLSVAVSGNAQSTGGRIRGTVTDPSGGAAGVAIRQPDGPEEDRDSASRPRENAATA